MRNMMYNKVLWAAAGVLMAGLVVWGWGDLKKVLNLDPLMLLVCLACTAGIALASGLKWQLALRALGETRAARLGSLVYYFMMGRTIGLVVPLDVSDFGVRTMSLKFDHSMSIGRASYSVYLDRTFDVVAAGLCFVPSVLYIVGSIPPGTGLLICAAAFVFGLVCFLFWGRQTVRVLEAIFRFLLKALCRIPAIGKRVRHDDDVALLSDDAGSVALSLYVLSGMKLVFTGVRFGAIALAVNLGRSAGEMFLFAPAAMFTSLFAFTPGGLGIADWSWSGLLYKMGSTRHEIVPYLVALRLAVTASIIAVAGASRMVYRKPDTKGACAE